MLRALRSCARLLAFRANRAEMAEYGSSLALGLACCWLVGIGRYWDDPRAVLGQRLGAGSVVCVFVLAAAQWGIMRPLEPRGDWSYRSVSTFV